MARLSFGLLLLAFLLPAPARAQQAAPPAPAEVAGAAGQSAAAAPEAVADPLPAERPVGALQDEASPAEAGAQEEAAAPRAEEGDGEEALVDEEAAARELAELQAAEAAAVDHEARRAAELFRALGRSGAADPLRARLGEALDLERPLPVVPRESEIDAAALAGVAGFDLEKARRLYDIPVEMHPLVAEYIRFFQGPGRKHYVRWLGRAARYLPMIRKTLGEAGLPQDTVFLAMIESGFSPVALSTARAAGLWQFIEPTGRRFGLQVDFWLDERRDPVKATVAAAGYLKELYSEFGDWRLAWAGYNAGAGKVRRAIREEGSTDFWDMAEGRVLKRETKHYVPKLMAAALISKNLAAFGFSESEIEAHAALEFEEAEVPEATDLAVIARAAGVSESEIRELNPQLRRWCTPPARAKGEVYRVRLPVGTRERFVANYSQIAPKDRLTYRVHKVQRGDTLGHIAMAYGTDIEPIMRVNHIKDVRRLRLGDQLVIPVPREPSGATAKSQARRVAAAPAPTHAQPRPAVLRAGPDVTSGTLHTVAAGDSLWSIAREHDVHVEDLVRWNKLRSHRAKLQIGQKLIVGQTRTAKK